MQQFTSIRITKDTRQKLAGLGKKSETYNDVIERVILTEQGSKNSTNTRTEEKRDAAVLV